MKHYNPSISNDAQRILNTKGGDVADNEVDGLFAVLPIVPCVHIVRNLFSTNGGDADVYTTPSDKDFYLTHVSIVGEKDAASTCTQMVVRFTEDGTTRNVIALAFLSLTARFYAHQATFDTPVRIPKNTALRLVHTGGGATQNTHVTIMGYTRETTSGGI